MQDEKRTNRNHFDGGPLMMRQRHISIFGGLLFVICISQSLFFAGQAYGCTGCCVCLYGGGYKNCPGCTPPGGHYGNITCPTCAVDESEAIQTSASGYSIPSGMEAVRELTVSAMRQLENDDVIRGGQCMRRRTELRLLGNTENDLNLHQQDFQ